MVCDVIGTPAPYTTRRSRDGRTFVPKNIRAWQAAVALQTNRYKPRQPLDGPVILELAFFLPMPKSWSKAKRVRHYGAVCPVKPDTDNLVKPVKDAMTSAGWWTDDSRIVGEEVVKWYVDRRREGGQPGVQILVRSQEP